VTKAFLIQGSTYINKDFMTASKELFVLNPLGHDNIDVGGYVLFEPNIEYTMATSKHVLIECFEPRVIRAKLHFHAQTQDPVPLQKPEEGERLSCQATKSNIKKARNT
jgi:hypothetical protein